MPYDEPQNPSNGEGGEQAEAALTPFPIIHPWLLTVSGLYTWSWQIKLPTPVPQPVPLPTPRPLPLADAGEALQPAPQPGPLFPVWLQREELRLDVDGRYPQMRASGAVLLGTTTRVHWIADLTKVGSYHWTGPIWYKDGNTSVLPQTNVDIVATPSWFASQRKATVTFSGGGAANKTLTYSYSSPYFHPVEFEYDCVQGVTPVASINTGDHPNRPASLPVENLSIETVFRRAGFDVKKSGGDGVIPLSAAGQNQTWSDMEMHDAMQVYWSRFANKAQWSMWVLFANRHDQGNSLGGIMFDDIGPNHRQGTALFNNSFIANAPAGDPAPAAWVKRMKYWTACHEMGHAFNLAHSWQKAHPPSWGTPWIPLANEPEARSFMNYPYNVSGGQTAFFADFEFRFSDMELLFMRHAPAAFVQMGNADWFDDHGFRQAAVSPEPAFALELRVNRGKPEFEYLEPPMLEAKLTNISGIPQIVEHDILSGCEEMTVILKKQGKPARQWVPFARYCHQPQKEVLQPGESKYESLFVAAGRNGWDLAEPGIYEVQVALHLEGGDIVSNSLKLRVAPPRGYDEEYVAQDFFSDEVGRIMTFDGSRVLESGLNVLRETCERLADRRVALHAEIALGTPLARSYKELTLDTGTYAMTAAHEHKAKVNVLSQNAKEAKSLLSAALTKDPARSAETLGHIDYKYYVDQFSDWLHEAGDNSAAAKSQSELHKVLAERRVLKSVLDDIKGQISEYSAKKNGKGRKHAA
ncbi:MAG: hypothetical protein ACFCUQ_19550 [Kiloniellales bacterium]